MRAWVAISVGCNNICTFLHRSRAAREGERPPPGDILREITALVDGPGMQEARERVHERDQPTGREAARVRDHVLLRDPALEVTVAELPGKRFEAGIDHQVGIEGYHPVVVRGAGSYS
jgi:hypothetical protein